MTAKNVTLVITTYNRPDALDLVLRSVLLQKRMPDEIIVADDGSGRETRQIIEKWHKESPVPLIHVWQEDAGFRLARSRNNAIRAASKDYLIFVDGDTILHRDFVGDHLAASEENVFVVGSRILLSPVETTRALSTRRFDFSFRHTEAPDKIKALHLPLLSRFFSRTRNTPVKKLIFKIRGCNMAFWRADCEATNGFNQDIEGWGREDSEFAMRLFKKGLRLKSLKFSAIQYHLHHPENTRAALPENDHILQKAMIEKSYRCINGLDHP